MAMNMRLNCSASVLPPLGRSRPSLSLTARMDSQFHGQHAVDATAATSARRVRDRREATTPGAPPTSPRTRTDKDSSTDPYTPSQQN